MPSLRNKPRVLSAATLSGYIHIDRRTGTVSYGSYPTASAQSLGAWSTALRNRAHNP